MWSWLLLLRNKKWIREVRSGSESAIRQHNKAVLTGEKMNNLNAIPRVAARYASLALVLTMSSIGARAQDSTTESVQHGVPTYNTEVRNAEIVYVQNNDLVLKLENGKVEHLVVPDSDTFTIDGKDVSVHELKPGTRLTQTITTTITPRYVNTVRTIKGKIWHVTPTGRVIVSLPDGTNQVYNVPSHAKVTVNGRPQRGFGLKKGMMFEATIVTDSPESVMEQSKTAIGEEPRPATPSMLGYLVIQHPELSEESHPMPEEIASAEQLPSTLPKTGTLQPLAGLLGALSLAGSLGLGIARKKLTV
jgi:LPXTG-motif cell wall-anchored protein